MAAELNLKYHATGATLVALIKGPNRNTRWNGSVLAAIDTIPDAGWTTGLVPLTELVTAGGTPTATYLGDFPGGLAAGEYAVEYYAGAGPAPGDEAVALQTIDWDGAAERTLSSMRLAADGLDTISTAAPSGVAATFREMIVQTWRRFFARTTLTATELKTFAADEVTVLTTQPVSDDGVTQTQGAAT